MRKETITYVDFNGEERSEDFYFHMTEAEIAMLEFRLEGGMEAYITKIINERDQNKIIDTFCQIIDLSYGLKGLDGGFYKTPEALAKFKASQAYSEMFMRMMDADFAASFIQDVMTQNERPKNMDRNQSAVEAAKAAAREKFKGQLEVVPGEAPAPTE